MVVTLSRQGTVCAHRPRPLVRSGVFRPPQPVRRGGTDEYPAASGSELPFMGNRKSSKAAVHPLRVCEVAPVAAPTESLCEGSAGGWEAAAKSGAADHMQARRPASLPPPPRGHAGTQHAGTQHAGTLPNFRSGGGDVGPGGRGFCSAPGCVSALVGCCSRSYISFLRVMK